LNHSLLLSTYYFFPICCTISNDLKFFKHVANLSRKKNPKKHHHFEHSFLFIEKWDYELQLLGFSQGQKNDSSEFECLYFAIHVVRISEIFTKCFQVSISLQYPTITYLKKSFFSFKNLVLVLKMAVLELFGWNHSQWT